MKLEITHPVKRIALIFLLISIASLEGFSQKRIGPAFNIGLGWGYSKHADSYRLDSKGFVEETPGFRALAVNLRGGWNFKENLSVLLVHQITPSNTTLSPYISRYSGIDVEVLMPNSRDWYFNGGVGRLRSTGEDKESVGSGNMVNFGITYVPIRNVDVQLDFVVGKMTNDIIEPTILPSGSEFQVLFTVNYHYRKMTAEEKKKFKAKKAAAKKEAAASSK